ncbi:MAG: ABC transporter permease, partial [Halanaerobiales bacterium]|nr:ABC transporter permease [Halanaerobiales bacterium]
MINLARVKAVMIKERQDIGKNSNILVMYFLPILMTLIWSRIIPNMPQGFALGFGLLLLVVMVGMYVPSMMIAEEKEKNTIEVLLLSPATPAEVFIGKGALTIILMFFTSIILIIIGGVEIRLLPVILVGTILTSIFSVFLGMVVGILSPNQMATGVIGMPIYLLLLLIPQLSVMGVEIINQIGKFLPT